MMIDKHTLEHKFTVNVTHREKFGSVDVTRQSNLNAARIYKLICDTQEQHIRKGLIELGWLPPKRIGYWRRLWEVAKWSKITLK